MPVVREPVTAAPMSMTLSRWLERDRRYALPRGGRRRELTPAEMDAIAWWRQREIEDTPASEQSALRQRVHPLAGGGTMNVTATTGTALAVTSGAR